MRLPFLIPQFNKFNVLFHQFSSYLDQNSPKKGFFCTKNGEKQLKKEWGFIDSLLIITFNLYEILLLKLLKIPIVGDCVCVRNLLGLKKYYTYKHV